MPRILIGSEILLRIRGFFVAIFVKIRSKEAAVALPNFLLEGKQAFDLVYFSSSTADNNLLFRIFTCLSNQIAAIGAGS